PRQSDHPQSRVINWDDAGDEPFARWIGGEAVIVTDRLPEPMRAAQAAVGVHTQVGFPIFIGAEFWGSIGFDDCTGGREWDEGELSALRVAATTIAGAVQRSRAEAEVVAARERAAEERAAELARANQALVGSLDTLAGEADLDHFLVAVLRRIREVSGAWAAHLFRYREKERTLALHVAVRGDGVHFGPAPGDPPLFAAPIPVDHSPGWAYMLETREIIVSGSNGRDDLFWPEAVAWHREQGHSELAALTLVAAGNPVGVLGLTFRGGGNLQATQAELVQTLLTQLTLALRLTSLAETAREAAVAVERERAVQERAAELVRANRALSRTLSRLGDGVDAEAFLRRVLQTITRHFAAPSSTLWLYDQERMEAHLHLVCVGDRVMSGPESDHPNALVPAPLDVGMFGDLRFAPDRRVRVTDVGDASISDSQRAHLHACGARAMIGVPLLLGDRVLGLIGVRIPEERPIRPEEREVAQALAHQATLALQLSRLAREAQDAAVAQERERAAHARAAELARANDALRRSADRLAGEGLPGPLLDGMLQEIAQAVAPADTAVYLREAASGLLRLHARVRGESAPSGRADGEWTPDERGATEFLGRLMAEGRDWAAFDTAAPTGEDGWDAKRAKMMAMGISSAVSVVLRAGDEVVGLLTVGLRGRPPLNAEEAELVRALANQAALVLLLTRLGDRAREEARASAVLGERNRIAREIHDTLAQGLTGIIFGLEGALRGAGETAEPVRRQVGAALEVARES
ncbi:MAG TPA: GAF domain-containing protein, partial [Longimicrobium sp.]|nr:GAF domain-containing protein [Longimicrobium sp.]